MDAWNTYQVHLGGEQALTVQTKTVDVGNYRLWFYDDQEHLIGCFWWKNIMGFSVEGSPDGQVVRGRALNPRPAPPPAPPAQ
jgi:hypothetical protein